MSFAIGQRWLSESENSLGLGVITAVDLRSVSITFPAANETRIYAIAQAPLTRVFFNKGEKITHQAGWQGDVLDIQDLNGVLFYLVKDENNQEVIVKESELSAQISFSQAKDRLFAAQIDRNEHFALRYRTWVQQRQQAQSTLRGLRGIRAGLIPHQLHIATEVGQRVNPRVLLADEVGLGKTIEAGMILQSQLFTEKVQRVLIIVPETLQHQWLVEMLRRFNLNFSLFDEERCADFDATEDQDETNPFSSESLIICALDWLVAQPKRAKQLLNAQFDLLIVDEAHHLTWSEQNASPEYAFVEQLAEQIPAILLLTATPEQLGQESHFARLRLLDSERFYDYAAFIAEQQNYQPVAQAVQSLLNDKPLSAVEKNHISDLLTEQDVEPLFRAIDSQSTNDENSEAQKARQELIQNLIDRHGTSRVLFRNTRQGVKGFPHRIYHQITLADEQDEPRIQWLIDLLKSQREEKILVICQTAHTAIQLEQILREKEGIRAAVFHEKMSIIERDRAAAYFSDPEGAQVLLSSSIGSEGRNFQFACHLVLFDLPQNPDLLEQCIGRLDRIGQQRDVQIYVPCVANSLQSVLARWYHEGLNAFEQTCPMGMALFAQFHQSLVKLQQEIQQKSTALTFNSTEFEELLIQTRKAQQTLKLELEKGRDRLLELNSNGGEKAQQIVQHIEQQDHAPDLVEFVLNLFDIIGVEQEDLGEKSIVITPTGTMLVPDFPGLKEEGLTVTFDRQLALAREEVEFLTWDHPMIRQGMDLVLSNDIGKTAVAMLINKQLPAGTMLLELVYVVEAQAPKGLQLDRFLPPTPIRLLLDAKGKNLSYQVEFETLQRKLKPIGKNMANKIVKMLRNNLEQLITQSEDEVANQAAVIIQQAKQQANQQLSNEIKRLEALKAVNKNIRQDEIDLLEQQLQQSLLELDKANWHLDCLRVIVTNKE